MARSSPTSNGASKEKTSKDSSSKSITAGGSTAIEISASADVTVLSTAEGGSAPAASADPAQRIKSPPVAPGKVDQAGDMGTMMRPQSSGKVAGWGEVVDMNGINATESIAGDFSEIEPVSMTEVGDDTRDKIEVEDSRNNSKESHTALESQSGEVQQQPRRKITTLSDNGSISVDGASDSQERAEDENAWAMMERANEDFLGQEGQDASRSNITLVAEPFPVKPKRTERKHSVGSRSNGSGAGTGSGGSGSGNNSTGEKDWANTPYYEGGTQSCYNEEDEICSIALMPAFLAAASEGNYEAARLLLKNSADFFAATLTGDNIFHLYARNGEEKA